MLGDYAIYVYLNPFIYFVGVIRNDLIGLDFDPYIWIGAILITVVQFITYIILYTKKRDRIVFWV